MKAPALHKTIHIFKYRSMTAPARQQNTYI